jgi:D-glycero-D-manno-heptose 1,7-bisphosphate phosphatase
MNRALFLDRDGILDELVFYPSHGEWESPRTLHDLRMVEGIAEPLRRIAAAGWLLVIITNQPSYAKGKTPKEDLIEVHEAVLASLASDGVKIDRSYLCFHHPDASVAELRVRCDCRKPGIASLVAAAAELNIDLEQSWMAGDQDSDLACGRAAGCRVALIENEQSANKRGNIAPDVRCRDLAELARVLISRSPTSSASP